MAIKEYRVPQANLRPIYKRPVRLPRDYVQPSKAAAKETTEVPLAKGQAPIAAQGRSPRYDAGSLMGLVSSLRSPGEANPAFDSSKPIGGENVPYKGTSGIGGVFSRIFGNRANELNLEAQQTQAAEMRDKALKDEERMARKEDLAEEIRLREEGPAERFKITQTAAEKAEANRVAAENKRLELENQRLGLTKQQIEDARQDRIARLQAEKEERDARIEDMRNRTALADAAFGRSTLPTAQAISTGQGGVFMYDPRSGQPLGTFSSPTIGEITNPKTGEKTFGPVGGGYKPYTPPAKAPVNTGGGQVDRATGATLGGPLPAPTTAPTTAAPKVTAPRSGLMNMIGAGAENVAGALGLDGITEIPAALGDLISRDPRAVEKAARSRARYLNPSMQRTY